MARAALILGTVEDIWGDAWDVRERRETAHGFDVALGWPAGAPRGKGRGGVATIVTAPLAAYLETRRYPARGVLLPIGRTTVKRLRRMLAIDWLEDHAEWWAERAFDLADLTLQDFAERHGVSVERTVNARLAMFGPRLRAAGWWRAADVQAMLASRPTAECAAALGIAASSVRRLRAVGSGHRSDASTARPPSA